MKLPEELKSEWLTAITDTREQTPVDLTPLKNIRGTLQTGDSLVGLEHYVSVERKSASDMLGCIGRDRDRFDAEVQRLLAYPVRALVIEAGWQYFERGDFGQSKITPAAAIGSLLGWIAAGLPVVMADDHERAGRYISRILFTAARRRWREARQLVGNAMEGGHDA